MKINEVSKPTRTNEVSKTKVSEVKKEDSVFMKELEGYHIKEDMKELLEKIDIQAERLSKSLNIKDVLEYKKLISEFLKQAVDTFVKFDRSSQFDARGRHRMYSIIKKVDEEMEGLTKEIIQKEKSNLNIVRKINDIKGMILDIYM